MAGKNTVTVTFASAGSQPLEDSFSGVGDAAKRMGDDVDTSAKTIEDTRERFDNAEQKAMGFRDTITGVQDSVKGFGAILKGDFSGDALLTAGMGIGDLASGFSNFLVPAIGKAGVAMKGLGTTFLTSPLGWVVLAIGAIVTAFVLLWNKSESFRNFWKGLWEGIKDSAKWAFNGFADLWNGTFGKIAFTVPSWVPGIGGKGFDMPDIPKMHAGGTVTGPPGAEVLRKLQVGEEVSAAGSSSTSAAPIVAGSSLAAVILEALMEELRARGLRLAAVPG